MTPHQIGYVMTSAAVPGMVNDIGAALRERLAGMQVDLAVSEVRQWQGPKLFVLIDD